LVVLGFPSNDVGVQEPGNEKQIQSFCRPTYGVEFPRWNFHKYLIDRQGRLIASYDSRMGPLCKTKIETIEQLL
jgi:glutathione peroxidase